MKAWLVLILNGAVLVPLSISTVRLLLGGATTRSERSDKRLGGLSAALALLMLCLIYSGEFKHAVLSVVRQETTSLDARSDWSRGLGHVDGFFTAIANFLKPGTNLGYRPAVTIWPATVLLVIYLARYADYRLARRHQREPLSPAYASHITAYLMAVAFMVVTVGWSIYVVVPVSLLVAVVFVAGLKALAEDLIHTLRARLRVARRWVRAAIAWLGLALTEAAERLRISTNPLRVVSEHLRASIRKVNGSYLTTVREPLRRRSDEALKRAERLEEDVRRRRAEQSKKIEARRREERT